MTWITGTLHAEQYKFLIISRSVLLRKINFSAKSSRENQNTHFMLHGIFFCENWVVYEIIWKSTILDRQAIDYNSAHAPCMVDNYGYKHTPRTHLKVTFRCTGINANKITTCILTSFDLWNFLWALGIAVFIDPSQCASTFAFTCRRRHLSWKNTFKACLFLTTRGLAKSQKKLIYFCSETQGTCVWANNITA
jgi:hypothetical protein